MSATPPQPVADEQTAAPQPEGALRKTFRAFHYRNFRLMWGGAFTSTTGAFVQEVAQSWLVYALTNDPFLLGFTVFLNNGPILLLSLFGGVAADRMDRRKLLIFSQVVQMSSAAALAFLIWSNQIAIWHILVAAFFTGLGQAFGGPAYQALIPSLVDRKDVPNAIALMSIQFNLAGVVGRAVGGVAFEVFGAGWCFGINALSFLAVIFSLLLLPTSFVPGKQHADVFHSLREGLRFTFSHKAMFSLVIMAIATAFLAFPLMTLLPVFAKDIYGLGPAGYSQLAALFGAGGVIGALFVAWMGNRENKGLRALIMQVCLGVATLAFGLVTNLWLAAALLPIVGAAVLAAFTSITSLVQLLAPEEMRGRIMSVYNMAFRGSMALGPPVAGYLSRTLGVQEVVAINGAILITIAGGFLLKSRQVRTL